MKDEKRIKDIGGVDFDIFLDNTPIIKYENKEMAERIQEMIKTDMSDGIKI